MAWLFPRYQIPAYIIASVMLALIIFPILHLLDVMMGLGMAAAFGVIEAMVLAPMLGIIAGLRKGKALVFSVLGAAFAIGVVTTAVVPAYSPDRPLALNFSAQYDMDERRAAVYAGARPGSLPKVIRVRCSCITLRATVRCRPEVSSSRAMYTVAIPPEPISKHGR